jgi:ribosomal biogenesis protein LAS1
MAGSVTKRRPNQHTKQNKRLRKCVKVTPWRDEWELEAVGRALLSVVIPSYETELKIEDAFEMVSMWKARSQATEGLSHAIESTYNLAHIYWRDIICQTSTISAIELRLSYSSAIVRTINGFADTLQQQRFMATSVSMLCEQLGIPPWLVDIRHEASHNALPTLSVLRLGASTLLEFLKNEFWIPTCPNWNTSSPEHKDNEKDTPKPGKSAIDYLLDYKSCATSFFNASLEETTSTQPTTKTNKKQCKPEITVLAVDPLFSDRSSDEDEEDPILGRVWGSSVGSNVNRFALLERPRQDRRKAKKERKKQQKKKEAAQPTQKKKPGEKYPVDFSKDFISAVSPQDGFSTAIMFLIWGGIGGAPPGRGVLIPGSTTAFPATEKGINKSWQRYSPLVQVLGRMWPGFCSTLFVHLVDFVLSIEDTVVENKILDPGSARKLYFLSAWIRFILSQQYITAVVPEFDSKSGRKNGRIELTLAELPYLEKLRYPLNSVCDRCSQNACDSNGFRKTSHDVLESIEQILGERRVRNFGLENVHVPEVKDTFVDGPLPKPQPSPYLAPSPSKQEAEGTPSQEVGNGCKMSLDEIEALLSDEDEPVEVDKKDKQQAKTLTLRGDGGDEQDSHKTDESTEDTRLPWVRCSSWDPCTLGTLPGYPL